MIAGMRQKGAKKKIFRHNDLEHLEELLKESYERAPHAARIVAFESVYSMSGTIAPIEDICNLARKYDAITYLDEVHAVGMYGAHGAGIAERDGCMHKVCLLFAIAVVCMFHRGFLAPSYPIMTRFETDTL